MPRGFLFPGLEVMKLIFIQAPEFLSIFFLSARDSARNTRGTAWLGWEEGRARLWQGSASQHVSARGISLGCTSTLRLL